MADSTVSFDRILKKYVGGHGKYQLMVTFVMTLVIQLCTLPFSNVTYAAYEPTHRCRVPQCEADNQTKVGPNILNETWLSYVLPEEKSSSNYLADFKDFDGCKMFKEVDQLNPNPINEEVCTKSDFNPNETQKCTEYIYDNEYFDETFVTKFDLVCDKEYQKSLLRTLLILGLLFGSLIGGRMGDQLGRKKAMFIAIALICPSCLIGGYVDNYHMYAFLHLFCMGCVPIVWVNMTAYMTEIFTPNWRYSYQVAFGLVPLSTIIYAGILYYGRTWTNIHLWTGICAGLALPLFALVDESVRWLALNDREDEALHTLLKMAKMNGRTISSDDENMIRKSLSELANQSNKGATKEKFYPWDMFRHGQFIKSTILSLAWITVCISFYAFGLNAADLDGHIITNMLLFRCVDFLGLPLVVLPALYFGVRKSLAVSHIILGICCLGLAFIPKEYTTAVLIVYMASSIVAGTSFGYVYLMTAELFPTNLRSQAIGSASSIARIFCMCAPFLGPLAHYWKPLPMVIVGVPIVIVGFMVFCLPDTYQKELPVTLKNAKDLEMQENVGNNNVEEEAENNNDA